MRLLTFIEKHLKIYSEFQEDLFPPRSQVGFVLVSTTTRSNHRLMSAFEFSKLQISFCVVKHYIKIMEEIMN